MKKGIALLLVILLMLAPAALAQEKPQKITLNEVTHSVFYAPQYVAMEMGFFLEEGIEIDLVNGGGSDKSMTAVLAGEADIGLMGPETAVYVYNQGKEDHAVIIGQLTNTDGSFLVGREKDEQFDWQKVKGKTIIGGRPGGMPLMTLLYVLKNKGILPGIDVNVRTDIQFNLMAGAFEGSDAAFVTLFEPTASLCEQAGKGFIVASVGAQGGEFPFTAYMVKKSLLTENTELYSRFIKAVYKGQAWVATHTPEEIAKAIAQQFPDADIEILTSVAKNYQSIHAWCQTPVMKAEAFTRLQDIIDGAGELSARIPFEKVVDNSIAQAVIAEK